MEFEIRKEEIQDHAAVSQLIADAFKNEQLSDHREQFLVERLRKSPAFIPELSLVAVNANEVLGHILLTKIKINNKRTGCTCLSLAPVSVKPAYQNKGIGSALIEKAHQIACALNYKAIVLIGHEDYYPRFGYRKAGMFGINFPFDAPPANCMVKELKRGSLFLMHGNVEYPEEFFQ